ncbi:MAG: TRAP transporter fused permease subunit [Rubrivivax sp.]
MRPLKGPAGWAVGAVALFASLFHLYTAGFGFLEPRQQRSMHLLMLLPIAFLLWPARASSPKDRPSVVDGLLALAALAPNLYSLLWSQEINQRMENVDALSTPQLVLGVMLTLLLLEALRRAVTPVLAGLVALGIAYLFVTEWMPGILHYRDMPFHEIVETMYLLNGMGAYGSITGIAATMVATFVVFGAFIEGSGIGRLFHNVGMRAAGRYAGGPAKVEVISSSLFGTISGSSVANVFATGSFTIPAMIKLGYKRHFAAGVEAASSVGGQIMPPVMGAGAFVMAEITNTPYSKIAIAALLGSLCYFFMILVSVHFEAKRLRLAGCRDDEMPSWAEIRQDLHLLTPVAVLVGLLVAGRSPYAAAFWATLSLLPVSWLRTHTRLYPMQLVQILVTGGRNMAVTALACAGAGVFVACLTVTGVVVSFSSLVTAVAGSNLLLAGALLMVVTLVLGMGVPTTAAYIIGAAIGAPILVKLGVPLLAAHMFVFYFAILADATPPVSVASYAAASIAGADPMMTGLAAFRLGLAGFLVGYSYLFSPALLMQGPVPEIVGQVLLYLVGLTLVAAGLSGHLRADLGRGLRVAMVAGALLLILANGVPVWLRVAVEVAALAGLWMLQRAPAAAKGTLTGDPSR